MFLTSAAARLCPPSHDDTTGISALAVGLLAIRDVVFFDVLLGATAASAAAVVVVLGC